MKILETARYKKIKKKAQVYRCRPDKHIYELHIIGDNIVNRCKNCRVQKIDPGATKRFRENIRDFGIEKAKYLTGI